MNVFSSLRVSQKNSALSGLAGFGFCGLRVAYYWQVDQKPKVRDTAQNYALFDKFCSRGAGIYRILLPTPIWGHQRRA